MLEGRIEDTEDIVKVRSNMKDLVYFNHCALQVVGIKRIFFLTGTEKMWVITTTLTR